MTLGHLGIGWPGYALVGTAFLLGCRHGLDWDHLAAITDLTAAGAAEPGGHGTGKGATHGRGRHSMGLAFWYCVGHGLVIALIGGAVGILGLHLPSVIDRVFETVVGGTLLGLGGFVLWQLGRDRSRYQYTGRVRLLVGVVRRAWARARRRGAGPSEPLDDLSPRSAFAVGVVHGTGAETPTQIVLFATAASASRSAAALTLISFLVGMISADLGIAASWLAGIVGARRIPRVQLALGAFTGISSVVVGTVFVLGRSAVLPALFGG